MEAMSHAVDWRDVVDTLDVTGVFTEKPLAEAAKRATSPATNFMVMMGWCGCVRGKMTKRIDCAFGLDSTRWRQRRCVLTFRARVRHCVLLGPVYWLTTSLVFD